MDHTDHSVPTWVEVAGRRLRRRSSIEVVDDWPRPPEAGDLRIAETIEEGRGESRVVVVLDVDPLVASARVVLASNETDMITSRDLLLPADDTDLPFDLVLEPDLVGELWWIQIGRRLGRLREDWICRMKRAVGGSFGATRDRRSAAASPSAARSFRIGEETALDRLAAPMGDRRGGHRLGRVPTVVDPALLVRHHGESAETFLNRLLVLSRAVGAAEHVLIPGESFDVGQLTSVVPELGCDLEVALRPIMERQLTEPASPSLGGVGFDPGRVPGPSAAESALANELGRSVHEGRPTTRLLTTSRAWTDGGSTRRPAVLHLGDGSCVDLIRHDLEAML